MPEANSDEELMLAYQLGDKLAFRELYDRHAGRVLAFIKSKTKDEPLAWDVFQSTFMKLHKSRSLYKHTFPFVPWLFTICRSELIDTFRKKGRIKEDLILEFNEPWKYTSDETLDLKDLTENQRNAVNMRFKEDLSFEEIAKRLQTSPSNARTLISRAIRTLRGLYGKK